MENSPSTAKIGLKWGFIVGLINVLIYTGIYVSGQVGNQVLGYLPLVVLIVGIVMAMRDYKNQNDTFMSFGQGLGIGTFTSAVAGLLGGIFTYVYMSFIDTTLMSKQLDVTRTEMEKQGLTPEQFDQTMAMTEKFMTPSAIFVISILMSLIIGFVASLIISAVLRNNKPEMDF